MGMIKLSKLINELGYKKPNFDLEWEEAMRYPEFESKEEWIELANRGYVTRYSKIKDVLGNVDLDFDSLEEPKKQRFAQALSQDQIEIPIAVKFNDMDYDLLAGNTRLAGLVNKGIDPPIWIVEL